MRTRCMHSKSRAMSISSQLLSYIQLPVAVCTSVIHGCSSYYDKSCPYASIARSVSLPNLEELLR